MLPAEWRGSAAGEIDTVAWLDAIVDAALHERWTTVRMAAQVGYGSTSALGVALRRTSRASRQSDRMRGATIAP